MESRETTNTSSHQQKSVASMHAKQDDHVYPSGLKLALLMVCIFTTMFLVSLDKLIISTAIPAITDAFHSTNDVGWYGTAYLLTNCSFQLVFGKVYKVFPLRVTFMASLLLFMTGSALCGAAPNSVAFILGRAIAGLGAGGVLPGVMVIIVYAVPLQKRPKYQGAFGATFGVASVLGPTVGGAFTTHFGWRWCFYINLPIGGVVMLLVFFLLNIPEQPRPETTLMQKLRQIDPLGTLLIVPGTVCLCLALQYGGTEYAWSNERVIALLVLAFLLLIAFCIVQALLPEQAILTPRVAFQRSIAAGFWSALCIGAHQTIFLYFLPIWFQAIKGKSAVTSGVDLLAMVIPIAVIAIVNGQLVSRIGYYTPSFIFGTSVSAIAAGLFTTFAVNTGEGKWIGYQVLYGIGLGCATQAPNMAAQTVLPKQDVSIGASLMFFGQTLFGAVFVSVGENVFNNQLTKRFLRIPDTNADLLQSIGATDVLDTIPSQYRMLALEAYNSSLRVVFQVALCMACLSVPGAFAMEWRTVKRKGESKNPDAGDLAEKGKSEKTQNTPKEQGAPAAAEAEEAVGQAELGAEMGEKYRAGSQAATESVRRE